MDTYFSFSFKGLTGPPWEQFDVQRLVQNMEASNVPKERQKRILNCAEHMHSVGRGRTPNLARKKLQQLMIDYKNEGNQLYKEEQVNMAKQFYVSSVIVGNMLKEDEYTPMQNEIMSTLYCNMAACSNKKGEYRDTVQHCDTALRYYPENVKAHYRKAAALKNLRNYREALIIALEGQKKAQASGKDSEAQDFQPLITDLQDLISNPPLEESYPYHPHWRDMDRDFYPPRVSNTRARSMFLDNDWMNDGMIREVFTSAQIYGVQRAQVSATNITPDQDEAEVDESWLEGTNVNLTNKQQPLANGKGKKKNVKKPVKGTSQPKKKSSHGKSVPHYEYLEGLMDSSSDSSPEEKSQEKDEDEVEESSEEEEESEEEMPEEEPLVPVHDPTQYVPQAGARPKQPQPAKKTPTGSMGLDDFRMPAPGKPKNTAVPSTRQVQKTAPSTASLPYPFDTKYDFMLACSQCYQKVGEGARGYRHHLGMSHSCQRDILLIRPQEDLAGPWNKIRPRPENYYIGPYKMCNHFLNAKPCRIGEESCTFVHSRFEQHMWALDRNNEIKILEFIAEQRQKAAEVDVIGKTVVQQKPQTNKAPVPPDTSSVNQSAFRPAAPSYQNSGPVSSSQTNSQRIPAQRGLLGNVPGDVPLLPRGGGELLHPLSASHDWQLACSGCLVSVSAQMLGLFSIKSVQHECKLDTLVMRMHGEQYWMRIRERRQHRDFVGRYILCQHYTSHPPRPCKVGEDACSFAHNDIEQILWTMEKDGEFSLTQFLVQARSVKGFRFDLPTLLEKHRGVFHFLCRECFYLHPCRLSVQRHGEDISVCSAGLHVWDVSNCLLVHQNFMNIITAIEQRPFKHQGAVYRLCHNLHFCQRRRVSRCSFAHSPVERDVWVLENESGISRDDIVKASQIKPVPEKKEAPIIDKKTMVQAASAAPQPRVSTPTDAERTKSVKCPYRVVTRCSICWKDGVLSEQKGERCSGKGLGHTWNVNKMFVLLPNKIEIRPLPRKIPLAYKFNICRHVRDKRKCDYSLGGYCQFAHSDKEIEVWTWMCKNNVKTLDEMVSLGQPLGASNNQTVKISQGQSVVSAGPVAYNTQQPTPIHTPLDLALMNFYCQYCSIACNSQRQWDAHCASDNHEFNVNSDKEHQWNYRQPPWGVPSGKYEMCQAHIAGKCRYSGKADMYNYCKFAHSQLELDEWKERWEWRQMKRDIAKKDHVYSYMDILLEEYQEAAVGTQVLAEKIDGVTLTCSENLKLYCQDKSSKKKWTFDIKTKKPKKLSKVALLHNKDRLHFTLNIMQKDMSNQMCPGEIFAVDGSDECEYIVTVMFSGGMYGSFMQWVVFDFDARPCLVQKLIVELGTQMVQEKVRALREKLTFNRWTSDNREIVEIKSQPGVELDLKKEVMQLYKAPSSAELVVTQQSVNVDLNQNNYPHKMHKMLALEELTQHQIISSYNLKVTLDLTTTIEEETAHFFAKPEELFAKVPLNDQLTEDSDAGKLVLTSVSRVLLAPIRFHCPKVYEAEVVLKENFGYDVRGRDYIYLCLPANVCKELHLHSSGKLDVEIQFQMNREPFCRMHFAVDLLKNIDIVFPNLCKVNPLWNEKHVLKINSQVLNDDQMKIVRHIVAERIGYTAPLIIYGPFGTGKTETLAQASMVLMKECPQARVLICTHSNSAADLFITKHFDAFTSTSPQNIRILRVYHAERRPNTVPQTVLKYCLLDGYSFVMPSKKDILNSKIVIVTLSTSLALAKLGLEGCFSHIFLDEGAQALECEAIMPLSLAVETTCVVLAGDHMQMSPKVYSKEACKQNFHQSLLERLYHHYDAHSRNINNTSPLNILLSINYRTKMEILRFISAVFYGGPDRLIARSNQPECQSVVPLTFYTTQGCEVQDRDKTSYYNIAEIDEVVERVAELYDNWPPEWGTKDASTIGVVTPYYEQVLKIRNVMRRKHRELYAVSVERVNNIQGKEFRAVFISTVRTRHLDVRFHSEAEGDGEGGDLGFLSDQKLLNTALTRAQSFVGVVGDPVALCSIGDCVTIWRAFLKHCNNMRSIHPHTVTLETIKAQVVSLSNHPIIREVRDDHASENEEVNRRMASINLKDTSVQDQLRQTPTSASLTESIFNPSVKNSQSGAQVRQIPSRASQQSMAGLNDVVNSEIQVQELSEDENLYDAASAGGFLDDWNLNNNIEIDSILNQLARQAFKTSRNLPDPAVAAAAAASLMNEPLKVESIRIREEDGHAVVYASAWDEKHRPIITPTFGKSSTLASGDNARDEFDAIREPDEEPHLYADYTKDQLLSLQAQNKDRYLRCILHIENSLRMYALNMDRNASIHEVKIGSRKQCGRGFHGDEVLVEVIEPDDNEDIEEDSTVRRGTVVGIIKRAMNPRFRLFVCTIERNQPGIMVPLNRGIPRMFNLEVHGHQHKTRKDLVCVYTFTKSNEIVFHHYEPVNLMDPTKKLFVIRYLKWDPSHSLPLCVVVGVLPIGATVKDSMRVLNIENGIQKDFQTDTKLEVDRLFHEGFTLTADAYRHRMDYREKLTFTIDPSDSRDLDDAVSIEQIAGGAYLVGVHIADVAFYVQHGKPIDAEARQRGTSYYPAEEKVVPMLPHRLSENLCSLLPGEDRLTLSLFLTVGQQGVVQKLQAKRCIIRSSHRLSYQDAENVIKHHQARADQQLQMAIFLLHRIAQIWRRRRLGNAGLYHDLNDEDADTPEAHLMISEIMITANHHAGRLLIQAFPDLTPLRYQLPPDETEMAEWQERFADVAKTSWSFSQAFLEPGVTCQCKEHCSCIATAAGTVGSVIIDRQVWSKMVTALSEVDTDHLSSIILNPSLHPLTAVAKLLLIGIQQRAAYGCSGSPTLQSKRHHSLNIPVYTHFTSPIRRYVDLVVQRMVVAALEGRPSPYSQMDMMKICDDCTEAGANSRTYENATHTLHYCLSLKHSPVILHSVVAKVTEEGLQLGFPMEQRVPPRTGYVKYSHLACNFRPDVSETSVQLRWSMRIYEFHAPAVGLPQKLQKVKINPGALVVHLPGSIWQQLQSSLQVGDKSQLLACMRDAIHTLQDPVKDQQFATDVTSEVQKGSVISHFSDFTLKVDQGHVAKVQLIAGVVRGLLRPQLQLIWLTPKLHICLEHHRDAVGCFSGSLPSKKASKVKYSDVANYQSCWKPVMAIEAVQSAVRMGQTSVVHNVPITWQRASSETEKSTAQFKLPLSFCEERHLNFVGDKLSHDMVCVRHANVLNVSNSDSGNQLKAFTWVGHCVITRVLGSKDKEGSEFRDVEMKLVQSSVPLPKKLIKKDSTATIEWIPKTLPDRRMERAVSELSEAENVGLAVDIAIGNQPCPLVKPQQLLGMHISGLRPPNQGQQDAIMKAFNEPFSLIQGPPGTGKTITGVHLAVLFCSLNRQTPPYAEKKGKPQVMYCGPSNKSVDVVAGYLKELKDCPKLVRVYSELVEREEFPLPGEPAPLQLTSSASRTELVHPDIALHRLIRRVDRPHAQEIREMDARVRNSLDKISQVDIKKYRKLLSKAEIEELSRAEVILVTCTGSSAPKIKKGTNIEQLLVDESGMCTEPENMVPIVSANVQQIVLLGDHQQLRPIVIEDRARQLGLETSLFERYKDKAFMLTTQYRMHQAIAAFPSKQFYDNQLRCGTEIQMRPSRIRFWPNGGDKPIMFIHIVGQEETLRVTSAEGNEMSKSNQAEVSIAEQVVRRLMLQHGVKGQDIVVLSQYRAQCAALKDQLKTLPHTEVSTVVASQGSEWDYVILSTVRSMPRIEIETNPTEGWKKRNLGFISDEHQINVAITRARKGLVIIGNKHVLRCDPMWTELLKHYEDNKKLIDAQEFMGMM